MSDVMIAIDDVAKRYGGRDVLRGVSLSVRGGEVCALLGENGSGKSTLLAIAGGILDPDRGDVRIAGVSIQKDRAAALANAGVAPERADVPDHLLAIEWLDLVASLKRATSLSSDAIAAWGLEPILYTRVGALSLGQHRRVVLAAATIGAPMVLLLDEPTNGLDRDMLGALDAEIVAHAKRGGAVLVATHDRAFAERVATASARIDAGRVAA